MVGGVIMTHGDDAGLRLPPKVAPVQVIIVVVKRDPDVTAAAEQLERELASNGLRVRIDDRTDLGLGRRLTDWELKGVPVRVEIGPRELAQGTVSIARRDGTDRATVELGDAATAARDGVELVHAALFAQATEALRSGTTDVDDLDAAIEAARTGFARLPWAACGPDGERRLNRAGLSVRCLTTAEGSVPTAADGDDLYAIVARAY
jgi:prolyl-tRNA synthetase